MKLHYLLFVPFLLLLCSCEKKEQKLVIESSYTIEENGKVASDHREAFVGSFRLNCRKKNHPYVVNTGIKAGPTRANMILFEPLYGPGGIVENKLRHRVAAEILENDSFYMRSQIFYIDSYDYKSEKLAGWGKLHSTDSIDIFFTITVENSMDTCICKGRKL